MTRGRYIVPEWVEALAAILGVVASMVILSISVDLYFDLMVLVAGALVVALVGRGRLRFPKKGDLVSALMFVTFVMQPVVVLLFGVIFVFEWLQNGRSWGSR